MYIFKWDNYGLHRNLERSHTKTIWFLQENAIGWGYADPITFAAISYIIYGLLTALVNREMSMGSMFGARGLSFSMILASVIATPIIGVVASIYEISLYCGWLVCTQRKYGEIRNSCTSANYTILPTGYSYCRSSSPIQLCFLIKLSLG